MPLKVKLVKKITNNVWSAVGDFSTAAGKVVGPAEILVKEVSPKQLGLYLNADHMISKINNREVALYSNVKPVTVPSVRKDIEVIFENILVDLVPIKKI